MQAIRIHQYGGPEVMQLEELPTPIPGPGQGLVRVYAASVNFLDVQKRRGELANQAFYQQMGAAQAEFPATMGSQGVGVVEAVGPNVQQVKIGDRVSFGGSGTYATHFLGPAARLIPIPDAISFETAAAGLNQGFLAYTMTHHAATIQPGDWVLIHAAAGGIGLLLCQMAKLRGAHVIGVVSSAVKAEAVNAVGADGVIISTQANIVQEARRISGGKGVKIVFDGVGKATFEASLDSLAPRGHLIIFGQSSGYVPPFDIMVLQEKGSLSLTRFSAIYYIEEWAQYAQQLVAWLQQGKLSIKIDRTYPLAEAAKAHAAFEQRQVIGRVLLIP